MRRVIFALLTSMVTVLVLLPPPAGAVAVAKVPRPVFRQERVAPQSPEVRALVVVAKRQSLSVPELRAEWQHVAVCEVAGNWSMTGPSYSGIGFLNSTWNEYGGVRYAPLAGEASRDEQILIGMRVTGGWVPDQDGCSPSGW